MPLSWETAQHTSFTLWDIDREFQNANEAYDQLQARQKRKRSTWACLAVRHQDDALARVLRLGRTVQKLMEAGRETFGPRFEQGDSTCHAILSAQLLRLQYEIRQPLYDTASSHTYTTLDFDFIITTAKSIQRTVLGALHDQFTRFGTNTLLIPSLPPPRFKVNYCPFADQLRKDLRKSRASTLRTQKLRPNVRHDDRELCPHCSAIISVAAHSGLPDYRCILFTSHLPLDSKSSRDDAKFACNSCYKTFTDSYAFLEHMFQRQIGGEKSCMRRSSSMLSTSTTTLSTTSWTDEDWMESDPQVVEQCLKNCLLRELSRVRTLKKRNSEMVLASKMKKKAEIEVIFGKEIENGVGKKEHGIVVQEKEIDERKSPARRSAR